jgi:hypothetical protein
MIVSKGPISTLEAVGSEPSPASSEGIAPVGANKVGWANVIGPPTPELKSKGGVWFGDEGV